MPLLHPDIEYVSLPGNPGRELGDDGVVRLANELAEHVSIKSLSLTGHAVGYAGAASLASALEKNATLHTLHLSFNAVGDEGAASLTSALEKNTTLQTLDLYGNHVGAAGKASLRKIKSLLGSATRRALVRSNTVGAVNGASGSSAAAADENEGTLRNRPP